MFWLCCSPLHTAAVMEIGFWPGSRLQLSICWKSDLLCALPYRGFSYVDEGGLVHAGVEGTVIAGKLLEKSEEEALGGRLGYNAATDTFEDLVAVGVIDPVKVARFACL